MFWIHGGGNTSGLKDLYDFSKLVKKHNVIVVTINYRLGPLGWFTHPAVQSLQDGLDRTSNLVHWILSPRLNGLMKILIHLEETQTICLLYTSPSPRD